MKYLYYTLYRLMLKIKTNDTPDWNAMFLISVFEAINIQTILLLMPEGLQNQLGIHDQLVLFAVIPGIILFVINYFIYVKNVQEITSIYKDESQQRKITGVVLLLVYSIGSFLLLFIAFSFST